MNAPTPAKAAPGKPVAVKPAAAAPKAAPVAAAPAPVAAAPVADGAGGQGRAIILPNGERRVDYIKRRYAEGIKRGAIAKELTEMNGGVKVPYQIVFAATKTKKEAETTEAAAE